ncbi:MAG: R3H domain-containing nucleic acid-binding protein [Oscillospiraceae bacterium]
MGIENVLITAVKQGESTILKVDGKNVGALIGRRGETMEALSYLTGLVANRAGGDYEKISLDVGGYRSKREQDLVELAKRIGEKVAATGRSHMLEPMNPYERRIIHSTISEMENVKSESTGEGADRRIVISCTGANAQTGYSTSSYRENDSHSPRRTYNKPQADRPFKPLRPNTNTRPVDRVPRSDFNRDKKFDKPKSAEVASTRTETINDAVDVGLYGKIEL